MSYLIVSIIAILFFAFYLYSYKEERGSFIKNFVIYLLVILIGGAVFFQDGITAKALTTLQPEGLISQTEAEEYVIAEINDSNIIYSWYGLYHFKPAIIVMTQKDQKRRKVIVDAFSGKLMEPGFTPNDTPYPTVREKLLAVAQERLKNEIEEKALLEEQERREQAAVDAYIAKQKAAQAAANAQPAPTATPVAVVPAPVSIPVAKPTPAPVKKPQTKTRVS